MLAFETPRATSWPGLSPAMLFHRRERAALPFPLDSERAFYFFRARNAIYHLMRALGLEDQTVLLPDYHSGSEVSAVRAAGANVRYFHIGRDLEPNLEEVRTLCRTERPRALIVIHYNGWSQPVEQLAAICNEYGVILIEDCAHALLSANGARPLGTFGRYSVFCLYKSVPVPNGAVLVCNDEVPGGLEDLDLRAANLLSLSGRTTELALTWLQARTPMLAAPMLTLKRNAGRALSAASLDRMPIGEVGFDLGSVNAAISPLSLSLLRAFDYESIARARRTNFITLRTLLAADVQILRRDLPEGICPLFFPIVVKDKIAAAAALRARGVEVIETWNSGDPAAQGAGFEDAQFLRDHVLELPIHPDLTPSHLTWIARQVIDLNLR